MLSPLLEEVDTELLLNAYVDGELDAASTLGFDRRLAAEPELAAARDKLVALRGVLRDGIPLETAPDRLRRAMAAQAGAGTGGVSGLVPRARVFGIDWRPALAACLVGALFGGGLTEFVLPRQAQPPAMAEVVADHLRAVMAPQPFDVASSDQHTVKPWFTGRLPFAPQVFDLSKEGFALVGGRVDVVGGQPAAALVFRHDKHLISLISQPVGTRPASVADNSSYRGFLVRDWVIGGMHYWAVSDVAAEELSAFETAARARLAQSG